MTAPSSFVERLAELCKSSMPFVAVTMVEAVGSTPQDAGSKMIVSKEGLVAGTVGGGKVEFKALEHAQSMLSKEASESSPNEFVSWNLQRDVGMTCGGVIKLFFETYNHSNWRVAVFGAGHVAGAVVQCLRQLDCDVTCIDSRREWLDKVADYTRLQKICVDNPSSTVKDLPEDAFVVCMTMGHGTDRPILEEIFRQERTFPFLGVIGSKSKRGVLKRELTEAGISAEQANSFHCPIGLPLGTNQPGEIAISVAAQLIQMRDNWRENNRNRQDN